MDSFGILITHLCLAFYKRDSGKHYRFRSDAVKIKLFRNVCFLALKGKHSIVESANTTSGVPHLVFCYNQNFEKKNRLNYQETKSVSPIIYVNVGGKFDNS